MNRRPITAALTVAAAFALAGPAHAQTIHPPTPAGLFVTTACTPLGESLAVLTFRFPLGTGPQRIDVGLEQGSAPTLVATASTPELADPGAAFTFTAGALAPNYPGVARWAMDGGARGETPFTLTACAQQPPMILAPPRPAPRPSIVGDAVSIVRVVTASPAPAVEDRLEARPLRGAW